MVHVSEVLPPLSMILYGLSKSKDTPEVLAELKNVHDIIGELIAGNGDIASSRLLELSEKGLAHSEKMSGRRA